MKREVYIRERDSGMTYREIAAKYGVSPQAVAIACGRYNPHYFHPITESQCIYSGLRNWMNKNQVSTSELRRRFRDHGHPLASDTIRSYMRGAAGFPMRVINCLLDITGLSYEDLFL